MKYITINLDSVSLQGIIRSYVEGLGLTLDGHDPVGIEVHCQNENFESEDINIFIECAFNDSDKK